MVTVMSATLGSLHSTGENPFNINSTYNQVKYCAHNMLAQVFTQVLHAIHNIYLKVWLDLFFLI
jgi:hypothetical protein